MDTIEGNRYCAICLLPKPSRAHHCSTCNKCCNYMDHHCPFTMNCVGQNNYRFFFSFVTWAWLATIYAFWLVYHPFSHCSELDFQEMALCQSWTGAKVKIFHVTVACVCVMSLFWFFVVYLLTTGQSTRAFLNKGSHDPLTVHRHRGVLYMLEFRLGRRGSWWRYLFPFALSRLEALED